MDYTTVFVGMDVHKDTFSLCCYTNEKEVPEYEQKVTGHYSKILNYIDAMRKHYGDDAKFICGYEAGCLGFTLYHDLTKHNVNCVILQIPDFGFKTARKLDSFRDNLYGVFDWNSDSIGCLWCYYTNHK